MLFRTGLRRWFAKTQSAQYPNGLFQIEGLHEGKDFARIAKIRVENARSVMNHWRTNVAENPSADIETLDSVSNSLCGIADAAEFIRNVEADPEWIAGATEAVEVVSGFMNEANVDSELYVRAKNILDQNKDKLDKEDLHVISAMVEAMQNEGVDKKFAAKTKLVSLQEQDTIKSFQITTSSSPTNDSNVWINRDLVNAQIAKMLPFRLHNGQTQVKISSNFLRFVTDRPTRQHVWESSQVVSDSMREKEEAMHELVQIRTEIAHLRGYKNWNHYAQRESVLSGPAAVESFLADLWTDLAPGVARDLDLLTALNKGHKVEAWDLDYLTSQWKQDNSRDQGKKTQLTFQKIMAGGQTVLDRVLGVDMQYDSSAGSLWHPDAFRLKLQKQNVPFSYLYIDPYERESKSVQSAQFTLAGSKILKSGVRQIPQTALVLSLPRDPSLAVPLNVGVTFFHELGHACHSLMSETKLQHFSGSRGAIDFVEFPSHLFEYFVTEPNCLFESVERNSFGHLELAQQLAYAMVDQTYYATGSPKINDPILALLQPNSVASFDHLVHYGGSYYCYLLCRALAAQVWDKSFRGDPWNPETGQRLANFFKQGSVDQSLETIFAITNSKDTTICTKPLIRDISNI